MRTRLYSSKLLLLALMTLACNFLRLPAHRAPAVTAPAAATEAVYLPLTSGGRVFYIAPNGDNTNPGSQDKPWAAIVIAPEELANARFSIVNVTVDDYLGQNYLLYVQYDHPDVPAHIVLKNTILSGRGAESPIFIAPASTIAADHNLFYLPQYETVLFHGEKAYTCGNIGSLGEGNLCGDPLFVHPAWGASGDYHLQAGSPAIEAGSLQNAPGEDLENLLRTPPPDIGAYEYR